MVELLLEKGANRLRIQWSYEDLPIHRACNFGLIEIAKLLLESEAEAQVNFQDIDGNTPLHYAALRSHQDIWKLLVSRGANPNIRNIEGMTALDIAEKALDIAEKNGLDIK